MIDPTPEERSYLERECLPKFMSVGQLMDFLDAYTEQVNASVSDDQGEKAILRRLGEREAIERIKDFIRLNG